LAGIYIHIPFCRRKCHYCNFFSSASQKLKTPFLHALQKEIIQNAGYLRRQTVSTIYFGGGTPSLLSSEEIKMILNTISNTFNISETPEITLEANPDDLTADYLSALSSTPINRLSIGVQSFFDEDLIKLNRVHTASQVHSSLFFIQSSLNTLRFSLSTDLIYGIPGLTDDKWIRNLETAVKYGIPHISAYALTVEAKTTLHWMIENKKYPPVSEEQAARQYRIMMKMLKEAGYQHYEISNFCLPGQESKHNSNYWKGLPYLGAGPSAHSYNGTTRRWNVSNITEYTNIMNDGGVALEEEVLTLTQRYNEYVMTGLRTMWGCDAAVILRDFGPVYHDHFIKCAAKQKDAGGMWQVAGSYGLTEEGMLFADGITVDFFLPQ
jgi:oxygen-independent coproporphyrinogen III oxidase